MSARIHISQIVSRVRSGISDMGYAQRRVFENRTGIATRDPGPRSRPSMALSPRPATGDHG